MQNLLSNHAYIALGSNLGNRETTLRAALQRLNETAGVRVARASTFIETEPVGGPAGQQKYLNAAAVLHTSLSPRELLDVLLKIESDLGRVRQKDQRNGPRTIDLDLLIFDQKIIHEPRLEIPHPRLHERHFVLLPLSEIAPDVLHPVLRKSIRELLMCLAPQ
jgi:2-amino-4-hydroxy-6-hydroxymethyldihydropteridine diphosphokinase